MKIFFILMDPTHNFENIYNNWVSRKIFKLPRSFFINREIIANFHDVRKLYTAEETKTLKIAHKINATWSRFK